MIRLEVEPYCENCMIFDADVEAPQKIYCGFDLVTTSDTVIHCSHRNTCANLMRYLKRNCQEDKKGE